MSYYSVSEDPRVIHAVVTLAWSHNVPNPWTGHYLTIADIKYAIEIVFGKDAADGVTITVH